MPGFHGGMTQGESADCTFMGEVDDELRDQVDQAVAESQERQQAEALNPELIDQHRMEAALEFDDFDDFVELRPAAEMPARAVDTRAQHEPEQTTWTTKPPANTDKNKPAKEPSTLVTEAPAQTTPKKLLDQDRETHPDQTASNVLPNHETTPVEAVVTPRQIPLIPKTVIIEQITLADPTVEQKQEAPASLERIELTPQHVEAVVATTEAYGSDKNTSINQVIEITSTAPIEEISEDIVVRPEQASPASIDGDIIKDSEDAVSADDGQITTVFAPTPTSEIDLTAGVITKQEAETETESTNVVTLPLQMERAEETEASPIFNEIQTAITELLERSEESGEPEVLESLSEVGSLLEELATELEALAGADVQPSVDDEAVVYNLAEQHPYDSQIYVQAAELLQPIAAKQEAAMPAGEVSGLDNIEDLNAETVETIETISAIIERILVATNIDATPEDVRNFAISLMRSAARADRTTSPAQAYGSFDRGTHENLIRLLGQIKQLRTGTDVIQRFIGQFALGRLHSFGNQNQPEAA